MFTRRSAGVVSFLREVCVIVVLLHILYAPSAVKSFQHLSNREVEIVLSRSRFSEASISSQATLFPMRTAEGERYMCLLPSDEDDQRLEEALQRFHEVAKERHGKPVQREVLMALTYELSERCYLQPEKYGESRFYQVCYETSVQIVVDDQDSSKKGIAKNTTYIGFFSPTTTGSPSPQVLYGYDSFGAHISSLYLNGELCANIEGEDPRSAEVRLYCQDSGGMQMNVQEIGTCKYLVRLFVPEACSFAELKKPSRDQRVVCYPL